MAWIANLCPWYGNFGLYLTKIAFYYSSICFNGGFMNNEINSITDWKKKLAYDGLIIIWELFGRSYKPPGSNYFIIVPQRKFQGHHAWFLNWHNDYAYSSIGGKSNTLAAFQNSYQLLEIFTRKWTPNTMAV